MIEAVIGGLIGGIIGSAIVAYLRTRGGTDTDT